MRPDRTHTVQMHMRGQRKQYGLKHHLTSTVHASMGDTLHKIVTEVSSEGNDFRLWDKAQAVVLLSRTKLGSDIIFVGDKMDTINALSSLIQTSNQWTHYMENVLEIGSINRDPGNSLLSVFNHQDFPFRICDIIVPQCNTGFVYMLVSIKVQTFCYIGETNNIHVHLNQHNSGYGSQTTCLLSLRPYALFAYVCGFEGNR
ncbi:TPA: GIY-YIG nuclease family protein, partial [Candidatus Poribacteria bacterium]|nr:GIY-YIG nuclease family protein [Candidatus Poribacteria bacterium]